MRSTASPPEISAKCADCRRPFSMKLLIRSVTKKLLCRRCYTK